ncbi:hypothetical protein L1987_44959 [Smallanthus sonchifolius]|uniref:Uncharacterized protein n=1 Tax=Smallanthus sonchifolius TaxID=185202 RepID=A0ACB9GRM8_9ASTR|nr:hypothetical protein L1987_44959 [Smallanthus sonchifolius]
MSSKVNCCFESVFVNTFLPCAWSRASVQEAASSMSESTCSVWFSNVVKAGNSAWYSEDEGDGVIMNIPFCWEGGGALRDEGLRSLGYGFGGDSP